VHFNVSPDGTLFAGDGGGPSRVAAPGNGQWTYLFRPQMVRDRTDNALPNSRDLIQPRVLKAEKLVNRTCDGSSFARTCSARLTYSRSR